MYKDIYMYVNIYIYIYNAEINDKEYYFFSELRVSCCLRNNLQPNELQRSNLLPYNGFVFYMTSQHKTQENPLYSRERCPRE